jgi:hypothetical protein
MPAATWSKSRKRKQRRLHENVLIPLGDSQASHEYEYKDDEELRLENVLFGTLGDSSNNALAKGKGPADTSMSHLLDDEVRFVNYSQRHLHFDGAN